MPASSFPGLYSNMRSATEPLVAISHNLSGGPRARSEPLLASNDIEMAPPPFEQRSQSERCYSGPFEESRIHNITPVNQGATATIVTSQQQPPPRAPSLAATDVENPESQDIVAAIQSRGVKIRDFAYSASSNECSGTTPAIILAPITESFDQYKALAEVEYRWTQTHRTYPVTGKTLRRLLDMGWIKQEDLDTRGSPMDIEELRKHDARPIYPWKSLGPASPPPNPEERQVILNLRRAFFFQMDRMRCAFELKQAELESQQREADEAQRRNEERERQRELHALGLFTPPRPSGSGVKRSRDDDGSQGAKGDPSELKRVRLTPPPQHPPLTFAPPPKQYPAPLHTYDPELYPDAASIIESSSQTQSQPRPIVPPRSDTPPFRGDTPPLDDEFRVSPRKGQLVHPKHARALKGALSRTQTFTQL